MLTVAALVVMSLAPDAGHPDGFIYRDQATSSVEVSTQSSETWKITNRTFENFLHRGRHTIVKRTVAESYVSMDNERAPRITLEFFVDFAPAKPASFLIERTANELVLHDEFADVITYESVPDPDSHELVELTTQKTVMRCSGDYLIIDVPNAGVTSYLGYEKDKKDQKRHGRLVLATRTDTSWSTSEVTFRRGKTELQFGPTLRLIAREGDKLQVRRRREFSWWPKVQATTSTKPNLLVRLDFNGHIVEVPITEGKLQGKSIALP